jgi:GT2 family glycosyltransferase
MHPLLSVVVVTYNSEQTIASCLRSLESAIAHIANVEIVVVDNASTDRTLFLIETASIRAQILRNSVNVGFAAGANQGARAATGDLLLFLNPDCIVHNTTLRELLVASEKTGHNSIIGIQLLSPDGKRLPSFWRTPTLFRMSVEAFLPYRLSSHWVCESISQPGPVDGVTGACLFVPRSVFESLGGFDERYFLYYEDLDLCYAAWRAGIGVYGIPTIAVIHHVGVSTADDRERLFRHLYRGRILFAQKYFSRAGALVVSVLVWIGIAVRAVGYFVVGLTVCHQGYQERARIHMRLLLCQ